jgi:uncharacterized secreted protein with C-terminal beta-propeller domain
MKKEDIFEALGDIDADVVLSAAPKMPARKKNTFVLRLVAVAACIALLVSAVVVSTLLLNREDENQPDVPSEPAEATLPERLEKYKDSEYIEVIKAFDSFLNPETKPPSNGVIAGIFGSSANVEITDNQVKGIEEADKIKRTDKHIFYMDGEYLRIFTINGKESVEVGSHWISSTLGNQFFLSDDAKTVTVISKMDYMESDHGVSYTDVYSLDVSDPSNITQKVKLRIKGGFNSARMSNGKLLLFVRYGPYEREINFSKPLTFLPSMDRGNGYELLPNCDIICNEVIRIPRYNIAMMFDAEELVLEKSVAALSYYNDPYVSEDKIFFSGTAAEGDCTNILCVDYSQEKFKALGSVKVEGAIKDQWSMDEYNGILRVVTGTSTSADLYCISLESFDIIASVKGFAPEKERVRAVRFDGTNAYVCTSITQQFDIIDPVFFFDLSDLNNISYKVSVQLDGMSTSLVNFGNGCAIGIGQDILDKYGYRRLLKIEAYKESADGVVVIDRYELSDIRFSTDYKSYYIDRKNKLVGFGYTGNWNEETESFTDYYALIKFDFESGKFIELLNMELNGEFNQNKRSVYIDGYLYMFGENDFKVEMIDLDATANE